MDNISWPTVINKGLSLIVFISYIIMMGTMTGFSIDTLRFGLVYLLFLSFIWFGDFWGGLTGIFVRGSKINVETPGWMVCAMGWFFMVGLPIVAILLSPGNQ